MCPPPPFSQLPELPLPPNLPTMFAPGVNSTCYAIVEELQMTVK